MNLRIALPAADNRDLLLNGNVKGPAKAGPFQFSDGAAGGNRTHDLSLTKDALYH